ETMPQMAPWAEVPIQAHQSPVGFKRTLNQKQLMALPFMPFVLPSCKVFAHLFHIVEGASSIIDKVVDLPLPDIFFKRGKGRGRVTSCKTADVHHGLICCKLISRRRCALTVAATQVYVDAPFCNKPQRHRVDFLKGLNPKVKGL
ncbi:hypothetical protein LG954_10500, partial [Bifidobacterium longum subsp. infantis]|nr:hypothetical protein [Bifidobacterium longum subsp. infantis]